MGECIFKGQHIRTVCVQRRELHDPCPGCYAALRQGLDLARHGHARMTAPGLEELRLRGVEPEQREGGPQTSLYPPLHIGGGVKGSNETGGGAGIVVRQARAFVSVRFV